VGRVYPVGGAEGTGGIRLVRDMHQDHFPPHFEDEKKVMMVGSMYGEDPEDLRHMQGYSRSKDSPRQLTGIRLTSDIK